MNYNYGGSKLGTIIYKNSNSTVTNDCMSTINQNTPSITELVPFDSVKNQQII